VEWIDRTAELAQQAAEQQRIEEERKLLPKTPASAVRWTTSPPM
jgi:hypothetical protein